MAQTKAEKRSPWSYIQDWDIKLMGSEILDEEERRRWTIAFAIAGGLPYMWKEIARPISDIVYSLLELREGDKVVIVGESIEPAGWAEAMREIVGPRGVVDTHEIIEEARHKVGNGILGRTGLAGQWEWTYTHDKPDEYYDCVAILQASHHADDWGDIGDELLRVMKPGRRIVSAESVLGGPAFYARVNADVHIKQWFDKIQGDHVHPNYTGAELLELFGDRVDGGQCMEWRGIEMFWGRKPS